MAIAVKQIACNILTLSIETKVKTFSAISFFFSGEEQNFEKHDLHESTYLNEVYDTESIMHYGRTAFSKNAQPTILAIGDPNKLIGQRYNLSQIDIAQLNALYDCSGNI